MIKKLMLMLVFVGVVFGQVNVESMRTDGSKNGLKGDIGFTFTTINGNTDVNLFSLTTNLDYNRPRDKYMIRLNCSNVDEFINKGFIHVRWNTTLKDNSVLEAFSQYQYDQQQDLEKRILVGWGLRYEIYKDVFVGVGLMNEQEWLTSGEYSNVVRSTNYISMKLFDSFSSTTYWQPESDPDWHGDYRVLNESKLSYKLRDNLSYEVTYNFKYDSQPPNEVKNQDHEFVNGLVWRF